MHPLERPQVTFIDTHLMALLGLIGPIDLIILYGTNFSFLNPQMHHRYAKNPSVKAT